MEKLALYGGEPVRNTPFPSKLLGVALIGEEELGELADVVREQSPFRHYGLGQPAKVEQFEREFREYTGSKYALAVSSGSAALFCALAAIGIGPGDEVILPSFGWFSGFYAIVNTGALPVFAQIDDTMGLDPADFEGKITANTKAVLIIHYQGGAANLQLLMQIARRRGIIVIEDCAQALGASYQGKMLGTIGDIGITSFQANKIISCGEGGMVYTDNEAYFARAVRYHDLGFVRPVFKNQLEDERLAAEEAAFAGSQFRMSELSGAFMRAQLRKLPGIVAVCRAHHEKIRSFFRSNPHFSFRPADEGDSGITLFVKFPASAEAARFAECLRAEGISLGPSSACSNLPEKHPIKTKRQFTGHLPPFGEGYAGEHISYGNEALIAETNRILDRYVAIGLGPLYRDQEIEDIIRAIEKVERALYGVDT